MSMSRFDWRTAVANDPRYLKEDDVPARIAGGLPGERWKERVLGVYLRDDQMKQGEGPAGVVPTLGGMAKSVWRLVFGAKAPESAAQVQDVTLGPEEAAVLVQDGQVKGVYSHTRIQEGKGFIAWIRSVAGSASNYRLLIVDANPFKVEFPFSENGNAFTLNTKDNFLLRGSLSVQFQFDQEKLVNVISLFRGGSILLRDDIHRLTGDVAFARVLVPMARDSMAADFRSSRVLQDRVIADILQELKERYLAYGLAVRDATLTIAMTDEEKVAVLEQRRSLDARRADGVAGAEIADLQRDAALETRRKEVDFAVSRVDTNLRQNQQRLDEVQAMLHSMEMEKMRRAASVEADKSEMDRQARLRSEQLADVQAEIQVRRLRSEIEQLEGEKGLLLRERREAMERQHLEGMRRIAREDDIERDSRMRASQVAGEVARAQAFKDLTPEQLLAMRAETASDAARVLAARHAAEAARDTRTLDQMRELVMKQAEVANSLAQAHGGQMAEVAKAAAGAASVQRPVDEPKAPCPSCAREVLQRWRACPFCGQALLPNGR